jgi:hypothetical protein
MAPATGTLRPHEHDWWLERAAVREFDGGEPRAEAEFRARLELLDRTHARLSARVTAALEWPSPRDGCTGVLPRAQA